jgi:hypothetical protein
VRKGFAFPTRVIYFFMRLRLMSEA